MTQWYLSYEGKQVGPFDQPEAARRARENPKGYAWREGYVEWQPLPKVAELLQDVRQPPQPPPLVIRGADEVDYRVSGGEAQWVEVELDPQEGVIGDAGLMIYKAAAIEVNTPAGGGAGHDTLFTHTGTGKAHVAFAAPFSARILPVALKGIGGSLLCQSTSFLCAAKGIGVMAAQKRNPSLAGFGDEGYTLYRIEGDGMLFLCAHGSVIERSLAGGEVLDIDPGCLVAAVPSVSLAFCDVTPALHSSLLGGRAVERLRIGGPGRIWLQSTPPARVLARLGKASGECVPAPS